MASHQIICFKEIIFALVKDHQGVEGDYLPLSHFIVYHILSAATSVIKLAKDSLKIGDD